MRLVLAVLAAAALLAPAATQAQTRPVGAHPFTDAHAARLVHHSKWEPRPANFDENHHVLTARQFDRFHAKSDMPYKDRVTGHYRGTTDEIIQWAAAKHGIDADVERGL